MEICEHNKDDRLATCIKCTVPSNCKRGWGQVHGKLKSAIENKKFMDCINKECIDCKNIGICSGMMLTDLSIRNK